jgi:hypothetical protein
MYKKICFILVGWVIYWGWLNTAKAQRIYLIPIHVKIPAWFKGGFKQMKSFMRRHSRKKIKAKKNGDWEFYFVSFLKKPLNDLECIVNFYDLKQKRAFVDSFIQYVDRESAKGTVLIQKLKLERRLFKPNRQYEMEIISKGRRIARTKFKLVGKEPKRDGIVTFTDKEAKGQ